MYDLEKEVIHGKIQEIRDRCEFAGRNPTTAEKQEISRLMTELTLRNFKPERALTLENTKMEKYKSNNGPFESFGLFLQAVRSAGVPGGGENKKLLEIRSASGLSETVPSDGGYLVQTDFANQLLESAFETGRLSSLCQRIELSSNSNRLEINGFDETSRVTGSRFGGIRGYWMDEAAEKTASKPKFRKLKFKLNKLIGLCYATDELLDDVTALEGVIRRGFAEEFGFLIDDAIINGTGAGQPLGINTAGCMVTQAAESGQGANTVIYENALKMSSRLLGKAENAVWLVHRDVLVQLGLMTITGSSGGVFPVYLPPTGASGPPYGTMFGRPVIPIEQCQALGTAGDIILANFKEGYILVEKGGMQSDMSIHVRFVYDESVFRFVLRIDGQPLLRTAITPYKGASTLSHFINLNSTRT